MLQSETCYGHLIRSLFVEFKWFVCVCVCVCEGGEEKNMFISAKNVYLQQFFTV